MRLFSEQTVRTSTIRVIRSVGSNKSLQVSYSFFSRSLGQGSFVHVTSRLTCTTCAICASVPSAALQDADAVHTTTRVQTGGSGPNACDGPLCNLHGPDPSTVGRASLVRSRPVVSVCEDWHVQSVTRAVCRLSRTTSTLFISSFCVHVRVPVRLM